MNQLLSSLEGVKRVGKKHVALCPCHSEKTPSLNISQREDGSLGIYCFGCGANGLDVYRHLGLNLDELFGGRKLEKTAGYISPELRDIYIVDKLVMVMHEDARQKGKCISWNDNRRNKLAIARSNGLKEKYPGIDTPVVVAEKKSPLLQRIHNFGVAFDKLNK